MRQEPSIVLAGGGRCGPGLGGGQTALSYLVNLLTRSESEISSCTLNEQ